MAKIQLRKMNADEFKFYSHFSFENFLNESAKSSKKDKEVLRKRIGSAPDSISENDLWLVVEYKKRNVGFVWVLMKPEEQEAFGYDIYLEKEFRSKGLGRKIILACAEIVRQQGIKKFKMCVFEHNKIARNLYNSLGFREMSYNAERCQYSLEIEL